MDRSLGECGLRCVQVDRLTRSLSDFAKIVEAFEAHDVTFVSVTQAFNTTTSMGRLTLNMLLSFRSVRTRGIRRADSRQDRSLQTEGYVDGRPAAVPVMSSRGGRREPDGRDLFRRDDAGWHRQ